MRRKFQNVIAGLLLLLYVPLILIGTQGLHELAGCHHHHLACGSDECGAATGTSRAALVQGEDDDHDGDCPICRWFAQWQHSVVQGNAILSLPFVQAATAGRFSCDLAAALHYQRLPRAPPCFS